ncbi:MAG: SDR family NAD(P)-dependent oxidoreductase [Thiohalocapsa sp.]
MSDAVSGAGADQLRQAVRTIQALRGRVAELQAELQAERASPVAIVGMACRFAGAADIASFWQGLADGRDAVRPIPPDRWDAARWFSPDIEMPGHIAFREAAFLDGVVGIDAFDNELFGIAAREAAAIDPQQRILLELAWHALEDAAIRPDGLNGAAAGVFLGMTGGDHLLATLGTPQLLSGHSLAGAVGSIAAGRIAYAFGLGGPAIVVDTACSSSLVAVHLAVQALRTGECRLALAGGAHLMLLPNVSVALSQARMMAPDGRCKAFDAAADGFGQGEGAGIVVLKRLADAEADGDRILAVIAGTALNQDGRSAGITAPNQRAQEAVIRAALADAGLTPEAVDAIEAHGTGTALGDPIEMHALKAVFGGRDRVLTVGSVKSNIGHTAAAAGIAGLVKAVLMLRRQAVPPSLHFRSLNPHIELDGAPIAVPTELAPQPLQAVGVSSFGFSGTNAHVVLRQAPPAPPPELREPAAARLVISAHTRAALTVLVTAYRQRIAEADADWRNLCHTARRGRARLGWWVLAETAGDLADAEPRQGSIPELDGPVDRVSGRVVDLPAYPFQRRAFPRVRPAEAADTALFPGRLIATPSADRQLECVLDVSLLPWLADHKVEGRVIVPGAVFLALLLAVAPPPADALCDIEFPEPLLLGDGPVRLLALARADGSVGVASQSGADWVWHAAARVGDKAAPLGLAAPANPDWLPRAGWVSHLAGLGIEIGPAFQAIARIARGPVSLAELEGVRPAPPGLRFHPALLDAALQAAGGTLPAEAVLPVGIDRLAVHRPLSGRLRAIARERDGAIDIEVLADGVTAATIEGLRVRRLAERLPPTLAALAWHPAPAAAAQPAAPPPVVFQAAPGGGNMAEALAVVQRLVAAPAPLVFLTQGAAPPVSDPGAAQFFGLASALAAERPELQVRCIDVMADTPASLIEAELRLVDGEPVVALRPDGRYLPRLLPMTLSEGRVRLSGSVLVTGGLGGIGRHAAEWAAARGAEAVLLVGRSGGAPPPGLPAQVVAADIAAPDAAATLAAALAGLPPLRTVIHAAGIVRDGLVERLNPGDFAAALAPKLAGAWTLHRLTERLPLDHFLLFGSVASFIGAAGQAPYAAANAALDAFAEWRRAQGLPATTIAWGRWAMTGMTERLSPGQNARAAARGLLAMPPAAAMQALDAAILADRAVVMVASLDRPVLAETAAPVFAELIPAPAPQDAPVPQLVAAAVHQILGQPAEPGRPLVACGLDSLMAMDLRNRLNRRFGIALGLAELMGGADIAALAGAVEEAIAHAGDVEELTL